jgi:ATP-dependent RNA helicase DHX8/PRP22
VILLRAAPDSSTPSATEIDALVAGLQSPPPDSLSVSSSGRQAARLLFRSLPKAAEAARELWSLRLDGLHFINPHLPDAPLAAHAYPLLASLFASHASRLLDSDLVSRCAARSAELAVSIQSVKHRLRAHNKLRDFDQLDLQKRTLEAEKDLVDDKIAEYKAAMNSIRRAMLCGTDDEEEVDEEGVDVFGIIREGEDVDFVRLHMMMLRECRRLNEGLPIYAYRRKILDHIFNNQVGVMTLQFFAVQCEPFDPLLTLHA